jgi:nucleoid DNA-binding protein
MNNRGHLTMALRDAAGLTIAEAAMAANICIGWIAENLAKGKPVHLRGLGTFEVKKVARRRVSIGNMDPDIPVHGKIVFKPCEKLRKTVWGVKRLNSRNTPQEYEAGE